MVKVVSTRFIPSDSRSRDLYAPVPHDEYERLPYEQRLAKLAEYRRQYRKRARLQAAEPEQVDSPAVRKLKKFCS